MSGPAAPFGSEVVDAGLAALVDRYAAGTLTPVEATRAYFERIERHDPVLHAFVDLDRGGAMAAAAASAARWAEHRPLSPIDGVPVGIKANIAMRGLPWTGGLAARRGVIAAEDAACVECLRAAGAVLLGSLNMDEAAFGATGDNRWYGRTGNPHGAGRSPGGSSAGPAAAVAAGLCAAAIGTDTMGSVRIPAACCGVVGWSPRRGTIALGGVLPLSWSFDNVGVLARSVRDVGVLLGVLGGVGASGGGSVGAPVEASSDASIDAASDTATGAPRLAGATELAVLVVPDDVVLAPAVRRAFAAAAQAAREAGLRLRPLPMTGAELQRLAKALLLAVEVEAWVEHEALLRAQPDSLSEGLRTMLEWGARQSAGRLGSAWRDLRDGRIALQARLGAHAAGLLLPVVPCTSFGFDEPQPQIAIFTALGSIAGLSGLSLPIALDSDAAPGAVQILCAENAATLGLARRIGRRLAAVGAPSGFSS